MAKKTTAETAQETAVETGSDAAPETKMPAQRRPVPGGPLYMKDKLRDNALEVFGVGPHVLEGALHGEPESMNLMYAEKALKTWQEKKVAPLPKPVRKKGGR